MGFDDDELRRLMGLAVAESVAAQPISTPNPPVGAILVDSTGAVVGRGHTQAPGGPHAEVMALREAGASARGATAVVTLEPCNHTGRTGPCAQALIDAGVAAVHYAVADPHATAAGGAETIRAAGVAVSGGVGADLVEAGPLRGWLMRQRHHRPWVTAKIATTIDGRISAPDGTSRWITGSQARAHAHEIRARIDAIVVGTGTALADDPSLTARAPDDSLYPHQPVRVVLGRRAVPREYKLHSDHGFLAVASHDPADVLDSLPEANWILVEGGPAIIGAFADAGLIDEVHQYLAPTLLGAGRPAVASATVATLTDAHSYRRSSVLELGTDLFIGYTRTGGA